MSPSPPPFSPSGPPPIYEELPEGSDVLEDTPPPPPPPRYSRPLSISRPGGDRGSIRQSSIRISAGGSAVSEGTPPSPPQPPHYSRPPSMVPPGGDGGLSWNSSMRMPSPMINEVVLEWNSDAQTDLERSPSNASFQAGPPSSPRWSSTAQIDRGRLTSNASLQANPLPRDPVVYTFSQLSYNTMLLLPPPTSSDSRPLYHISVNMDCFKPSIHTTTLRRGASENGSIVGQFRLGLVKDNDIVTLDGTTKPLHHPTFNSYNTQRIKGWRWNFGTVTLLWAVSAHEKTCSFPQIGSIPRADWDAPLATLVSSADGATTALRVYARAQSILDHVVLTALIVQRERFDSSVAGT